MKTHIIFAAFTVLFLTACASHEGRSVSSTQGDNEEGSPQDSKALEISKHEANSGHVFNR